jgi:CspA family cold shock protein
MSERMRGSVKWFSNQRGYGFIAPEQGGSDIFVHFSNVQMSGYKTLREGQKVEFEVGTLEKNGKMQSNALEVIILPDLEKVEPAEEEMEKEEGEEEVDA